MALSFGAIVVHTAIIIICGKIWNKNIYYVYLQGQIIYLTI